jgi:hypothetical protein
MNLFDLLCKRRNVYTRKRSVGAGNSVLQGGVSLDSRLIPIEYN